MTFVDERYKMKDYGAMRQLRLRRQLREAVAEAEMYRQVLIRVLYGADLAIHNHWDSTGESGRGCPICINQREKLCMIREALNMYDRSL